MPRPISNLTLLKQYLQHLIFHRPSMINDEPTQYNGACPRLCRVFLASRNTTTSCMNKILFWRKTSMQNTSWQYLLLYDWCWCEYWYKCLAFAAATQLLLTVTEQSHSFQLIVFKHQWLRLRYIVSSMMTVAESIHLSLVIYPENCAVLLRTSKLYLQIYNT